MDELPKLLADLWGPAGLICGLLMLVVAYQYRENRALVKQFMADKDADEDARRLETAQWTKLLLEEKDRFIAVSTNTSVELTKAIGTLDTAMKVVAKGVSQ